MSFKVVTLWGPPFLTVVEGESGDIEMTGIFAEAFYGLQVKSIQVS